MLEAQQISRDARAQVIGRVERVLSKLQVTANRDWTVADELEPDIDCEAIEPSCPLSWLRTRLGLTVTEERLLWTLIAHELSPAARQVLRDLNTEQSSDPTIDTLRRVVFGAAPSDRAWNELGPGCKLSQLGLIERGGDSGNEVPEYRQTVRIARRVLALIHGVIALDSEVRSFAHIERCAQDLGELEVPIGAVSVARAAIARGDGLVILRGGAGTGRRSMLAALAKQEGRDLLVIDGRAIARERDCATKQLKIAARECALFDTIPLIQHADALLGSGDVPDRFDLIEDGFAPLVLATTTHRIARRWREPPALVEIPPLTGASRARLWLRALPGASEADAEYLATMYPMAPAVIHAAGRIAVQLAGGSRLKGDHIEGGVRAVLDHRLAGLATRIEVAQSWEDLILPRDQMLSIIELLARIRERRRVYEDWGFAGKLGKGLGVSALFSGPPGTGKTMCAGLIAKDLGTELYQVDLSKIVSKWIGETERNLAELFDAAEAGHAVLLFDEADAVFGKRTEVRSSNDRHANQETNYLLQRLETFTGICILTTNHENSIDEAFRRRLSIHVRFPVPETDERTRLWKALIPERAPVEEELPFDELAENFVMSGGYIRNAVLRAAFMAAEENAAIGARHLARAAQLEYEAMGKIVARHC